MKLIPLGVGDAFSALHYSSCLAIEAEDAVLLVDCPHPIRKMMREASMTSGLQLDVDRILGVAVTHLHADHASGLEGLGYFSHFVLGRKMPLLAHPLVAEELWPHHLRAGMGQLIEAAGAEPNEKHFEDFFVHEPLSFERPVKFGPFTIECRRTYHHLPTTAFRIHAGGRTLGYSADTSFDPGLIDWLAESDLVIHETNYGVHTPYERLATLPEATRAKMRLIHYPDEFDIGASVITALRQGVRCEV
jgi:ribonuclease BN (tRNA processing enzyme)